MKRSIQLPCFILTILPLLLACAWVRQPASDLAIPVTEKASTGDPTHTPAPGLETPATPATAKATPTERLARRATGITYDSLPGIAPEQTSLDLYAPAEGENLPVMIYIHGGGWSIGDKARVQEKPDAFNQAGYVFISLNYPLVPQVDVATQAQEIARAISWTHTHATEFGGDPQRIFLMGHSAGAHLAALVGADPAFLEEAGLGLEALSGVVALDTRAYDVAALMQEQGAGSRIYRQAFGDDPANWARLSPVTYVQPDSGIPPFAVAYSRSGAGRADIAGAFVEKLKQAGVEVTLIPAPEKTHAEINRQFGLPGDAVTEAVLAFLNDLSQ